MRIIRDDASVKIEVFNLNPYTDEINLLKVTRKDPLIDLFIVQISGLEDMMYWFQQSNTTTVDLSEVIRANPNGELDVLFETLPSAFIDWFGINGIAPSGEKFPPRYMPMLADVAPYYLSFNFEEDKTIFILQNNMWTVFTTFVYDGINSGLQLLLPPGAQGLMIKSTSEMVNIGTFDDSFDYTFMNFLADSDDYFIYPSLDSCDVKYLQVQWLDENGLQKSWMFALNDTIKSYDTSLSLITLDNGYRVQKDKVVDLTLVHRYADSDTVSYLSDIVYSSMVKIITNGVAEEVRVSTKSYKIPEKGRKIDFTISVNHKKYKKA